MILYGANPIAWSNDDDRTLGAHISLEQCLREAGEIGFDGIEIGHKMPTEASALRAALSPSSLRLVSGWHSLKLMERDEAAERAALDVHLNLLTGMGCSVCILAETTAAIHGDASLPMSEKPTLDESEWPVFTRRMDAIARHVADSGLVPVYHHHMGTVIQTGEETARLLDETGRNLKLLLDTGHACLAGIDVPEFASRHMGRVGHLHLKNVRRSVMEQALGEGWSFLEAVRAGVFTVPGDPEGSVDIRPVMDAAARDGYRGWLVVEAEQDAEIYDPLTYQSMGLKALRAAARAAGLDRGDRT